MTDNLSFGAEYLEVQTQSVLGGLTQQEYRRNVKLLFCLESGNDYGFCMAAAGF